MADKLNLNKATAGDLEKTAGITRTLAQRLVAVRDKQGSFSRLEELHDINGMTDDLFEALRASVVLDALPVSEKTLGIQILGRVYGETLSHEIGHSLIGMTLDSMPHHGHNASPGIPGGLMNMGRDQSFASRSGCRINGTHVTPFIADNLNLLPGIDFINVPTGAAQVQIDVHFPVPPVFR